jgi:superfamily II DNA/RNA helicase
MATADDGKDGIAALQKRLNELDRQRESVRAAIEKLEQRDTEARAPASIQSAGNVANTSAMSNAEKIALFRSLFRGRENVFPRRWENPKTGKSGYAPACRNEWVPGICEKPKVKCGAIVFDDVLSALEAGRSPVVITERTDHLRVIAERLSKFAKNVIVLQGGMTAKERNQATNALETIPDGEERVIVATGRYLGEGFDDSRLDTLFLTMPISWRGTLAQYAGRLHRLHIAKRDVVIYDYVDQDEPMLAKMAAKRRAGYHTLGYQMTDFADLFAL